MLVVPLKPVPNQAVSVQLGGQACQINVYQKTRGLFLDLYSGGSLVVAGCICQNLNRLVRSAYLGFAGDLGFYDTQGTSDPVYGELGTRFRLAYLDASDLAALRVPAVGS